MTEDDVRYIVATVEQYFQQADRAARQRQRG
jgi:hypothetical protein